MPTQTAHTIERFRAEKLVMAERPKRGDEDRKHEDEEMTTCEPVEAA